MMSKQSIVSLLALAFLSLFTVEFIANTAADETDEVLAEALPHIQPLEPDEAESSFALQQGFRMELLAAEPLVYDPVAMQYDENGLAYVVEMSDYPYTGPEHDVAWQEQTSLPIGRVRILEDTDGDGKFDKSDIFADKLSWPTGVAFWKGGIFVAATPDLWYFKDTDGDRKADIRQKVFTGFRKFNVQAVMNNLKWGLDHKIYAAGGSNGGSITPGDDPGAKPIQFRRNDFRIDPTDNSFEVLTGGARFGNTFDDFGNRYICNIRNPAQHIVLQEKYLARNPDLPVSQAINDSAVAGDAIQVFRISPPEPWRVINAQRLASDATKKSPRSEMAATGYVTSSSGITIYRGAAYPEEFYGNAFIAEVAGNLVMRYQLEAAGPTFIANRAQDEVDFLASTDNWFRPVNFVNAPDGTLHVLDMYRETIEHPWSIPDDIKAHLDLESGRDRGRIYRLAPPSYPEGHQVHRRPHLGSATISELVAELENPNSWWRETAHRLIYERQDQAAVDPLRNILNQSENPIAKVHALWSLNGLGALEFDDVVQALKDESPRVREQAVLLAETRLLETRPIPSRAAIPEQKLLLDHVMPLTRDENARVRFQVALSIGGVTEERYSKAISKGLAEIARQDAGDLWTRTAILSSPGGHEAELLFGMMADRAFMESEGREFAEQLAEMIGIRKQPNQIEQLLGYLLQASTVTEPTFDPVRAGILTALGNGMQRSRLNVFTVIRQNTLSEELFVSAEEIVGQDNVEPETKVEAIQLLALKPLLEVKSLFKELLNPQQPPELQLAAVDALGKYIDPSVPEILLVMYAQLTPTVRTEVVEVLLSRPERINALFDAIEDGGVPVSEISPIRRGLLMKNRDATIKERAAKLFATDTPGPRSEVIEQYQSAIKLDKDSMRGEKVFRRLCTSCHKLGNEGHDVGFNLATIKNRTPAEVLIHILDPNREVSPNFLNYIVITDEGRTAIGVIAAETASSITLRRAEGKEETILRQNIDEITSSGQSLMPEGLEKDITPQQMADLISFLLENPPASSGE
ncbi:Cytochrome c [Polystyrenella longa]|uniref:Cytochrome c n=1 Tax=Polystyrenella longa TaxID=2528007 RepID=A0A518CN17_9PLAN|nr:PVC-type heme-binding CxxCH protein [Polystyrenella longa]QDU80621.1 Cytochrome c [Polystyrenella longa]